MTARLAVLSGSFLLWATVHLPASDATHSGRCGPLAVSEVQRVQELEAGIQSDRPRPVLPLYLDAPSGWFRVHYAITGPDAVPDADDDGDGIPDYVQEAIIALDRSWNIQQQYQAPPQPLSDGMAGGSPVLDIYLRDLAMAGPAGAGYYGITIPDSLVSSGVGRWPRFTTWLEVDNDFAPGDTNVYGDTVFGTTGVAGLRITCAHELHHVAQLAQFGTANVQLMLYEQMATYMELICYPEYDDWRIYATKFFRDPAAYALGDASAFAGYVWGWFPRVYGASDVQVYAGVFSAMQQGERPFTAMVQATAAIGHPLDSTFTRLLPLLFYTGDRAGDTTTTAGPPTPELLPTLSWHRAEIAQPPAVLSSGELRPFEVRALQFTIPTTDGAEPVSTSVLLSWTNLEAYQSTEFPSRRGYQLVLQRSPDERFQPISGTSWGVRIEPADVTMWIDNAATVRPAQPYPLPVALQTDPTVYVPVPGALPGDPVVVHLRTAAMGMIYEHRGTVQYDRDRIVAQVPLPSVLVPGVYLLTADCNGTTVLHKIVVQR